MSTHESASAIDDSSMENSSQEPRNLPAKPKKFGDANAEANGTFEKEKEKADEDEEEENEREVWEKLSERFREVQSVLDQNRLLIRQVDQNHQSRIPDNLTKNVALIREINSNISKVVSLYSDLSTNFSSIVRQRRAIMASMASLNYSSSCQNGTEST